MVDSFFAADEGLSLLDDFVTFVAPYREGCADFPLPKPNILNADRLQEQHLGDAGQARKSGPGVDI